MVERKNIKYPFFVTCALKDGKGFYRIESLEQHLYDGSGISGEYISATTGNWLFFDQNFSLKDLINI